MAAYGRARCRALGGVNASLHSFCADDGHANCGVWIAVICSGTSGAEDWFTQLQTFTLDRLNPWFQHTDGMPVCAGRAISGGISRRKSGSWGDGSYSRLVGTMRHDAKKMIAVVLPENVAML